MTTLKKLLLGLVGSVFVFLLLATAFDVGLVRIATHPENIKKLVSKSGLYGALIPSVVDQAKNFDTLAGFIPADNPLVLDAANKAAPPELVQQNTEAAIDSVYRWLDGKAIVPDFVINLADVRQKFADNLAAAVEQHATGLPTCKTPQEITNHYEPLTTTCLPQGVTPQQAGAAVKDSLVNNGQGFVKNPTITAYDIKFKSEPNDGSNVPPNSVPLFQRNGIKDAPKHYQQAKKTPVIFVILLILTAAGIVFLSANWQKGLKHVGIILLVVGVLMMLFAWTANREVNKQLVPRIKVDNLLLQKDLRNLASDLTDQIHNNYLLFGAVYTVVGASAIAGAEIMLRRNQIKPDAAGIATSGLTDSPKPKAKAKVKTGKKL